MRYVHTILLLTGITYIAVGSSSMAGGSLAEVFHVKDLEQRRARLQHLGELAFGNRTSQQKAAVLSTDQVAAPPDDTSEPGIEEINTKAGVADYLFEGDINLTDEQLDWLEKNIVVDEKTRTKRQVAGAAALWTDKRVYYHYDATIGARKKSIAQQSFNYLQARTCVTFVENATAPNRVRVFNGDGCWSSIGMVGGVQNLSLGSGCDEIGIVAHEFAHTLGSFHTQMRSDRDNYVTVDLTNVPPNYHGNFAKLSPDSSINYTPYEYGSYMHYGSNTFATAGHSLIPHEPSYLRTLGSRVISFYDIKAINDHYGCSALCGAGSAACGNGGVPNPKNCATCICPNGYGGALCNQRPAGCGEALTANNLWKVKKFTFGDATIKTLRDTYTLCNHWISAPAGKRIQIRVTFMNEQKCGTGCRVNSIEPKVIADKRITNPRICCNDMLNYVVTSQLNPTPIISYNRLLTTTFTFHYRYI